MGIFTFEEDLQIIKASVLKQSKSWAEVFSSITTKSVKQCSDRFTKFLQKNYDKIQWIQDDDSHIIEHIKQNGEVNFDSIIERVSATQAAMRWFHHLKPSMIDEYYSNSWSQEEDRILEKMIKTDSTINWNKISKKFKDKSIEFLKSKWNEKINLGLACPLRNGQWTKEEDALLIENVKKYGDVSWKMAHLYVPTRSAKQCSDRWNKVFKKKIESKEEFDSEIKAENPAQIKKEKTSKIIKKEPQEETKVQCSDKISKIKRKAKEERKTKEEKKIISKSYNDYFKKLKNHNPSKWNENDEKLLIQLYQKYGSKWNAFKEALMKYEIEEIKNHFIYVLKNIADLNAQISGVFFNPLKEDILSYLPKAAKVLNADPDKIPTWIKILVNNYISEDNQTYDSNSNFIDKIKSEFNNQENQDLSKHSNFDLDTMPVKTEELVYNKQSSSEQSDEESQQQAEMKVKTEEQVDNFANIEKEIYDFMNSLNK